MGQPNGGAPRRDTYRYFVAFSFTDVAGRPGFGNCEVVRRTPLLGMQGPDGLLGLQEQMRAQAGWAACCLLAWPHLLEEDRPAIVVATAAPGVEAQAGVLPPAGMPRERA